MHLVKWRFLVAAYKGFNRRTVRHMHSLCHSVARQDWASKDVFELSREGRRQVAGCVAYQPQPALGHDARATQRFIQYH